MFTASTRFGPYEIVAPLGAGGMGEVYRARDTRLEREVALKLLPREFASDSDRLARFERETKAVAALAHPNILVLYDIGTEQGVPFAVTELLEGETLRQRVKHAALPWRKAVEIAVAIADGLAAAHSKGIIHRDLKPDNVFVTADERVKILDFGLAKVGAMPLSEEQNTQAYPSPTRTGAILGTAPYMSPEQLRGRPADARSDLFSFGCMLYEMLAGKRPFTGDTEAELVGAILHDDPPELNASGKRIPIELQRLVRRSLEKNPEARFQSARDLAFALKSLLSDGPDVENLYSAAGSRKRVVMAIGIAALLVALSAVGIYILGPGRAEDTGSDAKSSPEVNAIAILPFVYASNDAENEYLGDMIPGTIIKTLLEQRQIRVRPFSSVSQYRAQPKGLDLRAVGRELDVQTVVTGTVTPRKESFLLSVELVDVRDNSLLWSEHYDRKLAQLQDTHTDIAKEVCATLGVQLSDREQKRLSKRQTENSEAYLLFLEGTHWWQKWTEAGLRRAIDCLDRAVKLDPKNALAHSGRAMAYMGASYKFLNPREGLLIAKQAAEQAVQLDDELAEAHTALAVLKYHYDWDWVGAEREFKRTLELNPRYAHAHNEYGWFLTCVGRTNQAIEQMRRAEQLEPRSALIRADRAFILYLARQYDEVIPQAQAALAMDPNHVVALDAISLVHVDRGDFTAALAVAELIRPSDDQKATSIFAWVHARSGNRAEALRNLEDLVKPSNAVNYVYESARVYVALGENDQALNLLEEAVESRSPDLLYLKVEPVWDGLRSNPRFAALLTKMNLPP